MRRLLASVVVAVLGGSVLVAPISTASASPLTQPVVDAAVQVTADSGLARGHATPALAVDPRDPQTLVEADSEAYASHCGVHVSRDGGLTWSQASQPSTPPDWQGCGFAVTGVMASLAFTPNGTLYYTFSAFQPSTYQQRIYFASSADLGVSWTTTALPRIGPDPSKQQYGADAMPSLLVDRSDPNRVYVAWWSNNGTWNMPTAITGLTSSAWCRLVAAPIIARPWLAVSTDGGRTFSPAVDMAPGVDKCTTEPYLAQAKDGSLLAFFGQSPRTTTPGHASPANLFMSASHDRGKTFTVSTVNVQAARTDPGAATATSDWLSGPSPKVDPRNGDIYVTWESLGGSVPAILFKRSTDGGRNWDPVVKVNDADPLRAWHFPEEFPTMSVAPNGRVDIVWYDYRNDVGAAGASSNSFQDVYYSYSTDNGRTFSKNIRVNDRVIDRRFGPWQGSIDGPLGIVSSNTSVNVAWDDTRNGNTTTASQDIYFTRIRYSTAAGIYGRAPAGARTNPWLAGLLGAAIAIVGCGVVVLLLAQSGRRRADGTPPARVPAASPPQTEPVPEPSVS